MLARRCLASSKEIVMNSNGFTATRNLVRVTLIAGTLLAPVCAPSFAAEEGTVPATTVKYEDLNLATRQ